ncbi:MAG: hypothetical protein ACI4AQ_07800 [Lachnospiraceae bacterium]
MKLKSYLRGLGLGMVVTTLILVIAFSARNHELTDEEIIAKAKELGMVETSAFGSDKKDEENSSKESTTESNEGSIALEVTTASGENNTETSGEGLISPENTTLKNEEDTTSQGVTKPEATTKETETTKTETTTKATEDETKTEPSTKPTEEDTKKEPVTKATEAETKPTPTMPAGGTVTIVFEDIRSADMASNLLYEAGVIQDVDAFNNYLTEQGLATKVGEGEFEFKKGMTFEEIARIITRQR